MHLYNIYIPLDVRTGKPLDPFQNECLFLLSIHNNIYNNHIYTNITSYQYKGILYVYTHFIIFIILQYFCTGIFLSPNISLVLFLILSWCIFFHIFCLFSRNITQIVEYRNFSICIIYEHKHIFYL